MNFINRLRTKHINTYRFTYVEWIKREHGYDGKFSISECEVWFAKFKRPKDMTEEQAFKVLSLMYHDAYQELRDCEGDDISNQDIIKIVVGNLENFHFEILDPTEDAFYVEYKTLYEFGNYNKKRMKQLEAKNCVWHTTKFSREEVKDIYKNLGYELPKLDIKDKEEIGEIYFSTTL